MRGVNKDRRNKLKQRSISLLILSMVMAVDIVPLFSYATDIPDSVSGTEEITEEPKVTTDENPLAVEDESLNTEDTTSLLSESGEVGDTVNVTEETIDTSIEEVTTEETVAEPQMRMSVMSKTVDTTTNNYVLATDEDFSGDYNGSFKYIGDDEYVEIPHVIKGIHVTSYNSMFTGTSVKGVKSTNVNVINMNSMFTDMESDSLDISQLDTSNVQSMSGMFSERVRDDIKLSLVVGLDKIDTSNVNNMVSMFNNSRIRELDLRGFDTSKVTNFSSMFNRSSASIINLSSFDTTSAVSLVGMFYAAQRADIIGEEVFNTSNVTNMYQIFYGTSLAKHLDVSSWDTSKVTNMGRMFYGSGADELDLSNFDTANVTNMENMFQGSDATTIKGLENFNTSKVTEMTAMFSNASAQRLDLSSFDTSNITNMVSMFEGARATYLDVSSFDTSKVTNMNKMFRYSYATSLDLSNFDTSRVSDMSYMFELSNAVELDLNSFNTSKVTNMVGMFKDSIAKTIKVAGFDTTYVTDMSNMFRNTKVNELDLSSFDVRGVNNVTTMFYGTSSTVGIAKSQEDAIILNITSSKPSALTFKPKYVLLEDKDFIGTVNGSFKYIGEELYVEVPHKIRGVNVTSYKEMFADSKVKGVISTNTKVRDMSYMFKGASSTVLDIGSLNTSSVTNMEGMFQNSKVTHLDVRKFVTNKVTNMKNLFYGTQGSELDLGSFNLTNVQNTQNMFANSKAVKGFARTESDRNKLNASSNKPANLTFTLWGIIIKQTPSDWTNGVVDLEVESFSDGTTIESTEFVNNAGENLLGSDVFNSSSLNRYSGAILKRTEEVAVPEWGVEDAQRFHLTRGSSDMQAYWNVQNTDDWLGKQATHSVYVKNNGKYPFRITYNGLNGSASHYIPVGFSGRVSSTGIFRTSHNFIQYMLRSSQDIDATFWGHKIELGDKVTDYSLPLDKNKLERGIYAVHANGTYIFRATGANGETRTVAHMVDNIDKGKPKGTVTKSTEGWTSQDVTLYVNAEDTVSGVKHITLPDGSVVNGSEAEYIAKDNKGYTFKITDNAGNTETVSTEVTNIDRSIPELSAEVDNKNWTRDPVNIKVTSEESSSGLTSLVLLNSPSEGVNLVSESNEEVGNIEYGVNNSESDESFQRFIRTKGYIPVKGNTLYTLTSHTDWSFAGSVWQYGGDKEVLSDVNDWSSGAKTTTFKTLPDTEYIRYRLRDSSSNDVINHSTDEWKVKVEEGDKSTPYTPAPEDIQLINNTKTYPVISNGLYTFEAVHNNGATSETSINIVNIDLDAPEFVVEGNPSDWTEEDTVTLDVKAIDTKSGVKQITLPDGKVVNGDNIEYTVSKNGSYSFVLEDNVGNKRTYKEVVDKLMYRYSFYTRDINQKPIQGAGYELLRDGVVHSYAESDATGLVDFGKVPTTGKYSIKQTKSPEGGNIIPGEIDVDVDDNTDPEEFISQPRGKQLPATGTLDSVIYKVLLIGVMVISIWLYTRKELKDY